MSQTTGIPPEWRGILTRNERILWQGAPGNDVPYEKSSLIDIVFGLSLFIIIPVVVIRNYSGDSFFSSGFLVLFAMAILSKAAYDIFGRTMFASYRLRHSFYTLTNRRAFTGWLLLGRRRLDIWDITPATRIELEPGNPGSVYFAEKIHREKNSNRVEKIGFLNIGDARDVYDLMLKVQKGKA